MLKKYRKYLNEIDKKFKNWYKIKIECKNISIKTYFLNL